MRLPLNPASAANVFGLITPSFSQPLQLGDDEIQEHVALPLVGGHLGLPDP